MAFVVSATGLPVKADDEPKVTAKQLKQMRSFQEHAEGLGEWDRHYLVIEQATDNIFAQHGWESEADQYARGLVREVGRISPFKPHERSKVFMDNLQVRYGLTHDQRTNLHNEIQAEAIKTSLKHLKSTLPVAMEAIRTRAAGEPFTAEQVQRWSRAMKPLMDDSLKTVEGVVTRLKKTMTAEQRATLDADMKALRRRHRDMEKMVKKWQAGNWNPTDWGLQDDPIHAGAVADYYVAEMDKNRRVQDALLKDGVDENAVATDETEWEKYVRWFCIKYQCTDAQRTQAQSIFRSSKKEALSFRNARRDRIEKQEQLSKSAESAKARQRHAAELERLLAPIGNIFNRMKARLHMQVLTTEQRQKFGDKPSKMAAP